MAESWAEVPGERVVRLFPAHAGFSVAEDDVALWSLSGDAPAILRHRAVPARTVPETVAAIMCAMESAAFETFPTWVPGARAIAGPGGAGARAVRALALRAASDGGHHGPFLADLAEAALRGGPPSRPRFAPEVRAAGLARVLAAASGRPRAAILVEVPAGLPAAAEEVLVSACEWLAAHGRLGVWLTGAPLSSVDRVETLPLPGAPLAAEPGAGLAEVFPLGRSTGAAAGAPHPGAREPDVRGRTAPAGRSARPAAEYPAAAGAPHPGSRAEKTLEAALSTRPWAAGRAWNQTYRPHPLANPIRIDLLWRRERCVVEIDGPDHHAVDRSTADRDRDAWLHRDGYAVLRVTNAQVLTDIDAVVGRVERFVLARRDRTPEGP
ncbi:endonuclease domain-containing protein [Sphaerisporangium sp. NPDC004334]